MKTFLYLSVVLSALVLFSHTSFAQQLAPEKSEEYTYTEESMPRGTGLALGLKVSSFGPGLELTTNITPKIHLRLGGTYFEYLLHVDTEFLEVAGQNAFKTGSISLMANWQVARGFFFAGGALYNMFENKASGVPVQGFTLGVIEVHPEQIGELSVTVKPGNTISPYFGIGLGRTISRDRVVSFALELGAVYHGRPAIELEAEGMLAPTANEDQRLLMEDAIADFKFFPMINLQLSFRLF